MMKRYKIADLLVDMDVTGRTFEQARPYESDEAGPAHMTIACDGADIFAKNPELESADLAEYVITGFMFARNILEHDGYYLHSSAVVLDGKAYLFAAPSGTGKSTHTEKCI